MPRRIGSGTFARKLGARIRQLREEAGWTQEKLAIECRLDKGYMSQIEAGKRLPSLPVLIEIGELLGLHAIDLLAFDMTDPKQHVLEMMRRGSVSKAAQDRRQARRRR